MFKKPNAAIPSAKIPSAADQILAKAKELNLGNPHSDSPQPRQTPAPRNDGYWQRFERGWIYWTSKAGAHLVNGAIFSKWGGLGWEQGFLGFPTTDETSTPDGIGRYNHFENGSIYWTPSTGAYEIHGAIRERWAQLGWERSPLGYPITDETPTRDNAGRYNNFQHGSIQWTPQGGAHEVVSIIQTQPASATPAPDAAGAIRIDFEGVHVVPVPVAPVAPYTPGLPVRTDFEGSHLVT
jgi:uncharacterized protein with LGFP repeats